MQEDSSRLPGCTFGDPNGKIDIALFGDSHLGQWFEAIDQIAKDLGFKTRVYMHAGCSVAGIATYSWLRKTYETWCTPWFESALADIESKGFDYVLMANHSFLWDAETKTDITPERWAEGMRATIERIRSHGAYPILFGDNPRFGFDFLQCLVNNVKDVSGCSAKRKDATRREFERIGRLLMAESGGLYINMADLMCTEKICPVIIGNRLLYRDFNHLNVEGTMLFEPIVRAYLGKFLRLPN